MSGTEKMDGCALGKKPAFMSPRPKKKKRKPSTYYPNGLAAPKLRHHVLSVRLHRLVSQKWAGTIQFVQVSALLDMPKQRNVLFFFFKSGSQRKWKMSSQSSRTNVSCVNRTARLFCFLVPPASCYFGIIKESFPRYHSQPRWPCFYLREAASQRWDSELLNGLSFPHTVCIWNVNDCRMQDGAPSSKKKKIKSNQDSHRERDLWRKCRVSLWNTVVGMVC